MTKQIRFMSTTTNQTVAQGDHVRLNCFAQYYSEKVDGKLYKVVYYVFSLYAHRQWTRRIFRRFSGFSNDDKYRTTVNYSSNLFLFVFLFLVQPKNIRWVLTVQLYGTLATTTKVYITAELLSHYGIIFSASFIPSTFNCKVNHL